LKAHPEIGHESLGLVIAEILESHGDFFHRRPILKVVMNRSASSLLNPSKVTVISSIGSVSEPI
jgi:hypothetical protein